VATLDKRVENKFDSVYFASWGKSIAGTILPLAELNWLKWSLEKLEMHGLLS